MTEKSHPLASRFRRIAVINNIDYLTQVTHKTGQPPTDEANSEVRKTAAVIYDILQSHGCETLLLEVDNTLDGLSGKLCDFGAEAVFNLVESLGCDGAREPELPLLLESLCIPYTGNPAPALIHAFAKDRVKDLLRAEGLPFTNGLAVASLEELEKVIGDLSLPLFVKPARTDASIGIDQNSVIRSFAALREKVSYLLQNIPGPVLVEEYLPGREINVAIFPDPFTGEVVPTEIDFSAYSPDLAPIVTYNCKWLPSSPEYNAFSHPCADKLPKALLEEIIGIARRAFIAIGGRSYGRVDTRLDTNGRPKIIDINPNNDLDSEAGLAIAARSVDYEYSKLIISIANAASLKAGQ